MSFFSDYIITFVINIRLIHSSVVKEEIIEDDAHLPCFNGRVVSWVRSSLFSFDYDPFNYFGICLESCIILQCNFSWFRPKAAMFLMGALPSALIVLLKGWQIMGKY